MAKLNLEFYKGDDLYSDGSVEDDILEVTEKTDNFAETLSTDNRWAVLYHLTPKRRNLLEWYDFNKDAELLEIGAGCGAVTPLFCEKVKNVTAVELSKRRASIIANRTKKYDNLEIIVGNLNDIKLDKKFDYVTLIGVFEYAKSFTDGENPYETFLNNVKQYLKPNGTLIVAIENKFGIKYWAGAKEDHTGRLFDSIENYPKGSHVQTFGKYELEKLFRKGGFENVEFYYPYCDYKICNQIYTDETPLNVVNVEKFSHNYDMERFSLFDENLALRNLAQNNMLGDFSNSFLVFASNGKVNDRKVLYSKLRRELSEEYQIETSLVKENGKVFITKKALSDKAKQHIEKIYQNSVEFKERLANVENLDVPSYSLNADGSVSIEYISGENLQTLFEEKLKNKNKKEVFSFLDNYLNLLNRIYDQKDIKDFNSEDFKEFRGANVKLNSVECVNNANIDLILDNIIVSDGVCKIIDYEWKIEDYVPFKYILFRTLMRLIDINSSKLPEIISQAEIFEHFAISQKEYENYLKLEKIFQKNLENPEINYEIEARYLQRQRKLEDALPKNKRLLKIKIGRFVLNLSKIKKR